ncbi:MAG: sulfatase, partial [Cyclobacteriaceae bacterium]|nr:sulfatase [Cyclobacteriaceae bacterium]
ELPLSEVTIAETLKSNGYKTFFAGKWHLGDEGFFPEDQGFEINKGGHHKGSPPGGYYSPYKNPRLTDGPEGEYLTDRLTNESINFLQKNKDNPFFLYLSFYSVHTPIQASKKHIKKFQDKAGQIFEQREPSKVVEHEGITITEQYNPAYASMIYAMDENVGRLLNEIEELDLTENTVIFFTSDNGGLSTLEANRTAPTSVLPLRAGKGWGYEGGIRVPLIVKSLGNQSNGKNKIPVISNDFYPTILELAGLPLMPNQHLDGVSIAPLLNGGTKLNRDAIFWHYPHYHGSSWTPGAAIRSGDWKLVEFYDYEK